MKDVKISIIVPVHNMADFLPQCLDSIQNQTLRDIEVLVINDFSDDNSGEIILRYKKSDSRFLSFSNSHQRGLGATRNFGIGKASGKYLLFVDSDDWIDRKTCEILYTVAEKHALDILVGNYTIVYNRNFLPTMQHAIHAPVVYLTGKELMNDNEIFTAVWDKLWLRDFVISHNLQNDNNHYFEDIPFVIDGMSLSKNAAVINFPFYYYYRGNSNSITNRTPTDKHLADRAWVMSYLTRRISEYKNTILDKPLTLILAQQVQPALANLRNYKGDNKSLKSSLTEIVLQSIKRTKAAFLKLNTIPKYKKVMIVISPLFYNFVFKYFSLLKKMRIGNK